MTGATPIFAEVEPDYWCLDVGDVKQRITSKTKGVIGVHLFGQCYGTELIDLCKEHNLALIEDAAQAHGRPLFTMEPQPWLVRLEPFLASRSSLQERSRWGEGGMITSATRLEPESNPLSTMAEMVRCSLKKLEPTCVCQKYSQPLVVYN